MNIVLIIPTGIGCEIGGHAGDANPVAKLLGSCCDKLILHPNVVNASDINEMPENALYVEGSILDRFLEDKIELKEVKQNKILVAVNSPIRSETINAVNASRVTLGADIQIVVLKEQLHMVATKDCGVATGNILGCESLLGQIEKYDFDALAIASLIEIERDLAKRYFKEGGVNPWGGVEAKLSKSIANKIDKPVAHAPIQPQEVLDEEKNKDWDFICDPRMAPEIISHCFLHCVLKGLQKAPRIGRGLSVKDIDVMISPHGCIGRPHRACKDAGIPIIYVKENKCVESKYEICENGDVWVENYLEAAGLLMCMNAGIIKESVRRPVEQTSIIYERKD